MDSDDVDSTQVVHATTPVTIVCDDHRDDAVVTDLTIAWWVRDPFAVHLVDQTAHCHTIVSRELLTRALETSGALVGDGAVAMVSHGDGSFGLLLRASGAGPMHVIEFPPGVIDDFAAAVEEALPPAVTSAWTVAELGREVDTFLAELS